MRRRNALPTYRFHKASGQAIVKLSGRTIYLGPWNTQTSRDAYDRHTAEWLAAGRATPAPAGSDFISVVEVVNAYRKSGVARTSQADAYKAVMSLLIRLYGTTPAVEFGPLKLRAVRSKMVEMGWKRGTINRRIHTLRSIFKWAAGHELIPVSCLESLMTVEALREGDTEAPESEDVQPADSDHVRATIRHMTPTLSDMVNVQALTGMRAAELCDMTTRAIDVSGETWIYRPVKHKTKHCGKKREIAIGPRAQAILERRLNADLNAPLFSPAVAMEEFSAARNAARKTPASTGNRRGLVRVNRPGRTFGDKYDTRSYRKAIYYACDREFPPPVHLARLKGENLPEWRKRLGVDLWKELREWRNAHRWHPHQLRHAFGTEVRDKFSLDHSQSSLGHSNSKVTEGYAKVKLAKAIEVAKAIG